VPDAPQTSARTSVQSALHVVVNGEPRAFSAGCSLQELVEALGLDRRRVAVAVNREVVPRSALAQRQLTPGDRVEILEAVGGG
jgi:sulfur carrier protein